MARSLPLLIVISIVSALVGCRAKTAPLGVSSLGCAASLDAWMQRPDGTWPTNELLLGDQVYSRQRLWNLSHSKGNPVADLALSMATAQLNVAAGARPSNLVIEALFEADDYLLDALEQERRPQTEARTLAQLSSVLRHFNREAGASKECRPEAPIVAAHRAP